MSIAPNELVKKFNALPRQPKTPSTLVSNDWHFDVRFIPLEPPSHVLFVINPGSRYSHMERLPVGLPTDHSGMGFFPESSEEAAHEVAVALLNTFVDNFGLAKMTQDPPPPYAPWILSTDVSSLALAVGKELKRMGVSATGLHKVKISSPAAPKIAHESFGQIFARLSQVPGLDTPQGITFGSFTPQNRDTLERMPASGLHMSAIMYAQAEQNYRPPRENIDKRDAVNRDAWDETTEHLRNNPSEDVKRRADDGDVEAAYDYALRLKLGYEGNYDLKLSNSYAMKVINAPSASSELVSAAHAMLIPWYTSAGSTSGIQSRYLFAAAHHAEAALRHAQGISPRNYKACPAVLTFVCRLYMHAIEHFNMPVLRVIYPLCHKAAETRNKQMSAQQERADIKRLEKPNGYRCATPGCGIVSDTGAALRKCGGRCDVEQKPRYCSQECQRADWPNHKPFCKPGMPCSVIDTNDGPAVPRDQSSSGPRIGVQVPMAGGGGHTLTTSTMSPEQMRGIRDAIMDLSTESQSS